jgi:hypothetical protein
MTTDQLEHDLKTLAEPQADDERLHLAIRTTLNEQVRVPGRRRPRARLVFGAAAAAAATVAAALVAVIGTGGSSDANAAILARVVRAMTAPANLIVHVKETGVQPDGTPVSAEWWQDTNPPYSIRLIKSVAGQSTERSANGTTSAQYDPETDTVYEQPDTTSPTLIDPIESARAALTSGTAQVAGTVRIDGRLLYKVVLSSGVTGYFDRADYEPVYLDNPQRDGTVVRTEVNSYEQLPLTSENEQLLSVAAQHPGARIQTGRPPATTQPPTGTK